MPEKTKAVDLYSGVGGWSLGLQLAGIAVVASYEKSAAANETNRLNNCHATHTVNIRQLDLNGLPTEVDVVVGSPPCTQFSFSNRGGNGNLADGLQDVIRFLEIVDKLKPAFWAMENVPRLAKILDNELLDGGCLARFRHLGIKYQTFNMDEFGVPQRRRRCIVGNFDFALLNSYSKNCPTRTLRDVIEPLNNVVVVDPIFGHQVKCSELYDHDLEEPLDIEEARINHAAKVLHPIYNSMPFPDTLDRAVRTITATCTRVSRESIVIATDESNSQFRRLSVRERAMSQSFPTTFQFYGSSHGEKLRMVGNAIPPLFSYYIAHAILGTPPHLVPSSESLGNMLARPAPPLRTEPHKRGFRYRQDRSFNFSIAKLRLKSGVRFELNNGSHDGDIDWHVLLVFGTSKAIRQLRPNPALEVESAKLMSKNLALQVSQIVAEAKAALAKIDIAHLQAVWSHTGPGATRPFMLLDLLNEASEKLIEILNSEMDQSSVILEKLLNKTLGARDPTGIAKLLQNSPIILSGLILGGCANRALSKGKSPVGTGHCLSNRMAVV